jgi:uncharacterized OB-fold protein
MCQRGGVGAGGLIEVSGCVACGRRLFPARLRCPLCGGFEFLAFYVEAGTVEGVTSLVHTLGQSLTAPVYLGVLLVAENVRVLARIDGPVEIGSVMALSLEGETLIAAQRT